MSALEEIGFCPERLENAFALVQQMVQSDRILGGTLTVGLNGHLLEPRVFGRMGSPEAPPVQPDTIFLIASPSKPITTSAICLLLERGQLALEQPLRGIIPEVTEDKKDIRLIHLLTHTSGLPDMLPNNEELRAAHQPLDVFVEHMCRVPLDFAPGTKVQYQSCGIALLGEVVKRITGMEVRDFIREEFFIPLGMKDSFLGRRDEDRSRISDVRITAESAATGWNWNTDFWHGFGAPWGGMFCTGTDYGRFLQMMLNGGELEGVRIFSPATVAKMTTDQIKLLPDLSTADRLGNAWGLGWWMTVTGKTEYLGDLASPRAFGHGGATGTGVLADPATGLVFVFLTNQPGLAMEIGMVANAVVSAVLE